MNYSFPETIWVKTATHQEQMKKIDEEYNEIINFQDDLGQADEEPSVGELMELIDLYQALETNFRILERKGYDMDAYFKIVKNKNEARGYYKKD